MAKRKQAPDEKLKVEFITNHEANDNILSNALITQLMVTITQIGIKADNPDNLDDIIEKEKTNVEENTEQK